VGEHEHAGPVGRLDETGADASRAREGRLLIDAPCPQRELLGPGLVAKHAELPSRVRDRGQHSGWNTEQFEQHRIPPGRAELGSGCGRRVGREPRPEPVAQERVDGAHPERSRAERMLDGDVVLEQPRKLARREVRVERHAAPLANLLAVPARLEPVEHGLRSLVLPGHDRGQRTTGVRIPREHRLPLVVEPARGHRLGGVVQQFADGLDDRTQDLVGVLLHPAGPRVREPFRSSRLRERSQVGVIQNGLDGGGSLVDPEQQRHAVSFAR
jgi:hypothetical protein